MKLMNLWTHTFSIVYIISLLYITCVCRGTHVCRMMIYTINGHQSHIVFHFVTHVEVQQHLQYCCASYN